MANIEKDVPLVDTPKKFEEPAGVEANEYGNQMRNQKASRRVKIILEETAEIPPTGQFIGYNGVGYVLRPGEAAEVPEGLLHVLDDAIMSVPIVNGDTVVGFRDKLRFPYRVLERDLK